MYRIVIITTPFDLINNHNIKLFLYRQLEKRSIQSFPYTKIRVFYIPELEYLDHLLTYLFKGSPYNLSRISIERYIQKNDKVDKGKNQLGSIKSRFNL